MKMIGLVCGALNEPRPAQIHRRSPAEFWKDGMLRFLTGLFLGISIAAAADSPAAMIESLDKLYADCRGGNFDDGDPCEQLEKIERELVNLGYCNRRGDWIKGKAIKPTEDGFGDCQ